MSYGQHACLQCAHGAQLGSSTARFDLSYLDRGLGLVERKRLQRYRRRKRELYPWTAAEVRAFQRREREIGYARGGMRDRGGLMEEKERERRRRRGRGGASVP